MTYTAAVWNVNESSNRNGRIDAQLERIAGWDADLVVLRAVRRNWLGRWRDGLKELVFGDVFDTADWADTLADSTVWPHDELSHHKVAVTASRKPAQKVGLEVTEAAYREAGLLFPERVLVTEVELPTRPTRRLTVWNVGMVPGVSMGEEKVKMFEYVYDRLARRSSQPRLLAGDFNSPKTERNGRKIPWGADKPEYMRRRWQEAESGVLNGLESWGFQDVFTTCCGDDLVDPKTGAYRDGCFSHVNPIGADDPTRRRFDHMLVSSHRSPLDARYETDVLEAESNNGSSWSYLSDHAPLVAEIGS